VINELARISAAEKKLAEEEGRRDIARLEALKAG
jgi:hypothetical protein